MISAASRPAAMSSRSAAPNPASRCRAMRLCDHAKARSRRGFGETSADGDVTLEAVYCLGNCALSPAMMVDGKLYGRVDASALRCSHDARRAKRVAT